MIVKQGVDVSFAQGLDTKTDPKRVQMGKFLQLQNTIFTKGGLLQKRNGYAQLTSLPNNTYSYLTTFKDTLTAVGGNIAAYSSTNDKWVSKGQIQPLSLATQPVIRNNVNQSQVDTVIATNGMACSVYLEVNAGSTTAKYTIYDSVTGQNVVAPAVIPVSSGTVTGGVRVFLLGNNFIIVFTNVITAVSHLQYVAINSINPANITANADIIASYIPATGLSWDGYVAGPQLFIAYNLTTGSQRIHINYLTQGLVLGTPAVFVGYKATIMSVTADVTNPTNPIIYASFYDSGASTGFTCAVNKFNTILMNPAEIISTGTYANITSVATNGTCYIFGEVTNAYSFDSSVPSNYINGFAVTPLLRNFNSVFSSGDGSITVSSATGLINGLTLIDNTTATHIAAGTTFTVSGTTLTLSIAAAGNSASTPGDVLTAAAVTSVGVIIRSVGLASKAFIVNGNIYFLATFQSTYQPTYFMVNGGLSTSASPVIAAKLAYSNGGGYITKGLPGVTLSGTTAYIPYLFKDLVQAVNKNTAVTAGTQTAGIYSQTGINLASFKFGTTGLTSAEIGNDLHITGGYLSMYDGYLPVEHNFFLWPDTDQANPTDTAVWSASGGSIVAKPDGATSTNAYYYQFTYEWTDNQGNAFKSAPSIPVGVTTSGSGSAGSITLNIPTLRLTMKVANPVKVVIYRWSVAQQVYYQTTSITSPLLNDTTVDQVQFVDTNADSTILGNNILYTTGGVVEDVNAPGSNILTLFDSRLWLVDAEDPDLLWFSKQVIEATPVEMSDLFTIYIPPTTGTQGNTGHITGLSPLDDKIIIFKRNSLLYINGSGPDNTGANNQYSQAIFITAIVGCSNQKSIVLMPQGIMFQSDKGIWLLDRSLNTTYIGAPVENFTNGALVLSAVNVPETNQVRFTLDSGITLMYDYYYEQWGTFVGVPCVSSCIYQQMHTFINSAGSTYQETPGYYQDGTNPVLMMFQTGPLRLGALQHYQRAYFFYLLGEYLSPHKLQINLAYDYESSPSQSILVTPVNYSTPYGSGSSQSPYGQGNPYGGGSNIEKWRIFLQRQRCMAFGLQIQEIFDPSFGTSPGAGFTLSGLNIVMGFKKDFRPQEAAISAG